MSHHQNAEQNHIRDTAHKSLEEVAMFKPHSYKLRAH